MTMITKQIAGLLYSFSYQLQDNEGNVYWIEGVENCPYDNDEVTLELMGHKLQRITNKEIGSTYKILAREMDLTKPIEGLGVPIVELAKIITDIPEIFDVNKDIEIKEDNCVEIRRKGMICQVAFDIKDNSFVLYFRNRTMTPNRQLEAFNWLYTHHFNFFSEGTTIDLI